MTRSLVVAALLAVGCVSHPPESTGPWTSWPDNDASIEVGECEGSAIRASNDDTGGSSFESVVSVVVDPTGALVVVMDDMAANCCPSPSATVDIAGADVAITFRDVTSETSCDCMCITDFTVTTAVFPAGAYTVTVDYDEVPYGPFDVTVP